MPVLQVNQLSYLREQRMLFSNLSFVLEAGELLLIAGANGCGKSTLLRILSGLTSPLSGHVLWHGQAIQHLAVRYTENFHYVGHLHGIKLGLTVVENLQILARLMGHQLTPTLLATVLETLQLTAVCNQSAKTLSAGQKRRLSLAKLWLMPKKMWILDEPLTALDHTSQNLFFAYLKDYLANNGMVIMTSHHTLEQNAITKSILRLDAC